ncbi:MAG: hypothetical protein ACREFK_06125, partial [Stellaceae bacterium]
HIPGCGQARSRILKTASKGHFARWGYSDYHHLGALSAAVLLGHAAHKAMHSYKKWAQTLFECVPTSSPRLRFDVHFWCTTWGPDSIGIGPEFTPCSLIVFERRLIGVASDLFPSDLLNIMK